MRKFEIIILFLTVLLLNPVLLIGEEKIAETDSIRKAFPTITVFSNKNIYSPAMRTTQFTIFDKIELEKLGGWELGEIISASPGIFVNEYGGLGALKTVSIRGSSSSQALVLLDGVRLNSTQSGTCDLNMIPAFFLNNVTVERGGISWLYGANGISGAVNLSTDAVNDSSRVVFETHYGSFNDLNTGIMYNNSINAISYKIAANYMHSDGDYPFDANQFGINGVLRRKNGDSKMFSVYSNVNYSNNDDSYRLSLLASEAEQGVPGPVIQGSPEADSARLSDKYLLAIFNYFRNGGIIPISAAISARFGRMDYFNPESFPDMADAGESNYNSRDITVNTNLILNNVLFNSKMSVELVFSDLRSNKLQTELNGYAKRRVISLSYLAEKQLRNVIYSDVLMQGAVRFDNYAGSGNAISPMFGLSVLPVHSDFQFKAQASYNFRPPSLNELYYFNYGNTKLMTEKSLNFNLSATYVPFNYIYIDIAGFYSIIDDKIISVPNSIGGWTARNTSKALSRGMEFGASGKFFDEALNIRYYYTLQKVTDESNAPSVKGKQIIYVPQELISGMADYSNWGLVLGLKFTYTGFRFSMPDNDYASLLPSYALFDVFASYRFDIFEYRLAVRVECKNIFDEHYSVIKNYPMPGRIFRLSLILEY